MKRLILIFCVLFLVSGCAVSLPFNHRLSYQYISEANKAEVKKMGPISVQWIPPEFTKRIDVQGSSGFVGGGSQTRIPTGIALYNRILEYLDASIGVDDKSPKVLMITVIDAKSEFEYSAGFFNITPAIDVGKCTLRANFEYKDKTQAQSWADVFTASYHDPTIGGSSQTGELEKAWDDVAAQVGKKVISKLTQ